VQPVKRIAAAKSDAAANLGERNDVMGSLLASTGTMDALRAWYVFWRIREKSP
jgi:hypothetical protein